MHDLLSSAREQWPDRPVQVRPSGTEMPFDIRAIQLIEMPCSEDTRAGMVRWWPQESANLPSLGWCILPPRDSEHPGGVAGLVVIVDRLLGPGGCPWDQAQTHESLRPYLVEEAYEVLEAIDRGDSEKLCEELGDLLLQPILHAQIARKNGGWDSTDVAEQIIEKLIRRHPHVFGDVDAKTADEVLRNWDAIKQSEKPSERAGILGEVPRALPSLLRASQISIRAARVGFEWPSIEAVFEKLHEELTELHEAMDLGDSTRIAEELGDVLFTVVNVARWCQVQPEDALREMVDRFVARFEVMESKARRPLSTLTADEWDRLWLAAKDQQKKSP
ncbi:MAG TPA: nucleoside triphosphate pyrophosphohydrolase [Fimbriimonadaceae bacterium]|nr:nucleoside triphosphate pyrophosphohydrolase [Fimbriimonadaceae bacterium]HRJ32030.1 nucleoside triphosphate pyrophosphohydrolase [Fimbriimonadaceae bacterium]